MLIPTLLPSLTITGKLVDQNGNGLSGLQLKLYISPKTYDATSSNDGSFTFNNITDVRNDDELPTGYSVSNNYPNPFNPKTRIGITLPNGGSVRVDVYNLLGQRVRDEIERYFNAGDNYIDLELNGLPNGSYLARITLDEKYEVTKKLMLLYGSQHLSSSGGVSFSQLNKTTFGIQATLATNLDSLVATSSIIGRKTFKNLPSMISSLLSLGNLTIDRFCTGTPSVSYEGKTYNTVQIGSQCWLRENLDVGIMIQMNQSAINNGTIEKYCYNDDPNNCNTYGGLYLWNEAMQYANAEKAQGICPTGWHIPSRAEFQTLAASVSSNSNALKATGQGSGNGVGTNTSGFSALLTGYRYRSYSSIVFGALTYLTYFWSSTENTTGDACNMGLGFGSDITSYYYVKENGVSVRCIKD